MPMNDFISGMIVLVIPSFFVCVLMAILMWKKWNRTVDD